MLSGVKESALGPNGLNKLGIKHSYYNWIYDFFKLLFGSPRANFWGHYWGDSLTLPMLITALFSFDSKVNGSLVTRLGP